MSEVNHVRRLCEPNSPQIGRGERSRHNIWFGTGRNEFSIRQPYPHRLITELKYPALRLTENEWNQPGRLTLRCAQISGARPARCPSLRHGDHVQHFPRSGVVARLINAPSKQRGNLSAIQDILGMKNRHQFTQRSLRKWDGHSSRTGFSCASASTFARSMACSKS